MNSQSGSIRWTASRAEPVSQFESRRRASRRHSGRKASPKLHLVRSLMSPHDPIVSFGPEPRLRIPRQSAPRRMREPGGNYYNGDFTL